MRSPKSCNGCRAHYQNLWRHECELGYEMKSKKIGSFQGVDILRFYPATGKCPKPRTMEELINAPRASLLPCKEAQGAVK